MFQRSETIWLPEQNRPRDSEENIMSLKEIFGQNNMFLGSVQ